MVALRGMRCSQWRALQAASRHPGQKLHDARVVRVRPLTVTEAEIDQHLGIFYCSQAWIEHRNPQGVRYTWSQASCSAAAQY